MVALACAIVLVPFSALAATGDDEVSGRVWADINANGVREPAELGVPGIGVLLFRQGDGQSEEAQVDQTTSGPDGAYGFTGLTPGQHVVQFLLPEGLAPDEMLFFTHQDVGDDDAVDSDAAPFTGRTAPISFQGSPITTLDAGLLGAQSMRVIGGLVWEDRDDDGLDDNEPLMDGVTLKLLREMPAGDRAKRRGRGASRAGGGTQAAFEIVDTQLSSAGGPFDPFPGYDFYVLPSMARYVVEVVPPDSHETVLRDRDPSDVGDSDVDPVTRRSEPLVADRDHQIDIGLAPLGAIGDFAWVDGDGDGIQDPDEPGLEGVLVILERLVSFEDPDSPGSTEMWVFDDLKITDGSGFYGFGRHRPGTYRLRFVPPDRFGFTRFQEGDDRTIDSDAMPDSGLTTEFRLPDDAGPPSDAALQRIAQAAERAAAGLDQARVGAIPVGGGGPSASAGFPALYADQWDAGFIPDSGIEPISVPGAGTPIACATGKQVRDPEVTVSGIDVYRLPNGDLVFLVRMAKGLTKDYSFAVVLYIDTPLGPLVFLWEIHDKTFRVGQADPETGEVMEPDENVQVLNEREQAIVAFLIKKGVIPEGSHRFQVRSFHSPTKRSMTTCHGSPPGTLDESQTSDTAAP
jgi:hypothetical protein